MNTQSSEGVNIYEQRNCLNQLDEEIERTIRELNSLNSQTMHQARQIQKKITNPKRVSPNQSFSLNAKASPNTSFTDSLDYRDMRNNPKNTKSGHLQLSPGDLIPRDDPLKELGYGSPDHQLMTDPKEYPVQQEEDFNQTIVLSQPFNSRPQSNDPKKQKNLGLVQKSSPPRRQLCGSTQNTRESTYNSQAPLKESSILNTSHSRKSLQNLMEYHKLSNLDIPREKIHGQSRPEQYFGYQNNLRRKSGNQLERSPSASSVPNNSVVERLMQFGRQKEERLKMMKNGEVQKRLPYNKNSRSRVSRSYMMGEDSSTEHRSATPSGSNQMLDEQAQSITNFSTSLKRNSVGSAEMVKQQIDQAGGSQSELKSKSIQQLDKEDVFYELYKEGYGVIPEASEIAENATTKGELQNMINNMKDRIQRDQSPNERGLTKSKSQTKVTYDTKVSYGTLTKYKHVEPRYLNPTRDASKSPVGHGEPEEKAKPQFRPQLSKKSLEIASRLENSFQRLVDTSITKSKENKKKLIKQIDNEHSFQPKINKLSKALDERFRANVFNGDELHRWDQLYLMKEKYNMDREARQRQKEEEEANNKECTFHPQISTNSNRMYRDDSAGFAERASNWKKNKERRLDKEREYRFDKEMENCTFQPEVNEISQRFRNSSFTGSSNNLNDISNLSIRGIDQHFEKIDKANRMKKELEARQERFTGKTWKSQITVPKEFLFHKREEPYGNYVRENIYAQAGEPLESKISKQVLFMERGRDHSPQATRQRESFNDSWVGQHEITMQQHTFEDAVVRLHYELQRMEI